MGTLLLLGVLYVDTHGCLYLSLGAKWNPLMINCSAAVMAGFKESIIKLLDYDVQDMLRTNVCTIVIYLTFSPP